MIRGKVTPQRRDNKKLHPKTAPLQGTIIIPAEGEPNFDKLGSLVCLATGGTKDGGESEARGTSKRPKQRGRKWEATKTEAKARPEGSAGGKSNGRQWEAMGGNGR